jgi:hypothetical protein
MQTESVRWSVAQRFAFLEQRLYWLGRVNKVELTERFAISTPQASADVAHYELLAPGNMAYDHKEKAFLAAPDFTPRFMKPDARAYLSQLLLIADDTMEPRDTWVGAFPSHAAIPKVRRRMDPEVLRFIVRAIHDRRAIRIVYQSMSSPEPTERWIAPHGLGFDGFRWHARAWCYKRSQFLDMVIARFISVAKDETRPAEIDGALDREWNEDVTLCLAPHPELSPTHKRVIELDYGMEKGIREVRMKLAMVYYFERHLCLDLEHVPPERKQVVIVNREEVDAARGGRGSPQI